MFKTTRALVLREVKYKEADKMLTVLTDDEGKLSVKASGAMRKGCRYRASTQLLSFSEMTLFGNKGRWSLNEAETIEQFTGLRDDIVLLSLGTYIAEVLEALSDEDSPEPEMLRLGLNSLYAISRRLYSPGHIKAVFELRAMALAGYEPQLDACVVCGNEELVQPVFSTGLGGVLCSSCGSPAAGRCMPLCDASLSAMRHAVYSDMKKMFSFSIDAEAENRLSAAAEAYLLDMLERDFKTLDFYRTVK